MARHSFDAIVGILLIETNSAYDFTVLTSCILGGIKNHIPFLLLTFDGFLEVEHCMDLVFVLHFSRLSIGCSDASPSGEYKVLTIHFNGLDYIEFVMLVSLTN